MVAPWLLLPLILLVLDALRPREGDGSESVAAVCSGFCARSLLLCGNCIGLLSHTGHFLSTGNKYPFLLQRRLIPFDSWPLLLIKFSHAWRQSSVIEVSDLYSSSPLSSIFDYWRRYILMNLHVVQFQYGFELRGLTYSQFEQTFQDIIGWNLWHR